MKNNRTSLEYIGSANSGRMSIPSNTPGCRAARGDRPKKPRIAENREEAACLQVSGLPVNNTGTLQGTTAVLSWRLPYFATGKLKLLRSIIDTIPFDECDVSDSILILDVRTTLGGMSGLYPVFDITPLKLCSGVVTDKGIFPSLGLERYFENGVPSFNATGRTFLEANCK